MVFRRLLHPLRKENGPEYFIAHANAGNVVDANTGPVPQLGASWLAGVIVESIAKIARNKTVSILASAHNGMHDRSLPRQRFPAAGDEQGITWVKSRHSRDPIVHDFHELVCALWFSPRKTDGFLQSFLNISNSCQICFGQSLEPPRFEVLV